MEKNYGNYKSILKYLILAFALVFVSTFFGYASESDLEIGQALLVKDKGLFNFVRIYTMVCNPLIAVALVTVISLVFFAFKKYREGLYVAISVGTSATLNHFFKEMIQFDRPVYRLIEESGYSFPSGHSNAAAAIAVSLFIIVQNSNISERWKRLITFGLAFFAVSVALSRVMLGVHYASDILAGLILGSAVAIAAYLIQDKLYKKIIKR